MLDSGYASPASPHCTEVDPIASARVSGMEGRVTAKIDKHCVNLPAEYLQDQHVIPKKGKKNEIQKSCEIPKMRGKFGICRFFLNRSGSEPTYQPNSKKEVLDGNIVSKF